MVNTKSIIQIGIAFILLGVVAFTYHWGNDTVDEGGVGPATVQASVDAKSAIPISYILGGLVFLGGIVLVTVGVKRSSQ
jgi:hypothetical protein